MRLIFAGTPAFAAHALEALIAAGHDILLVLTQPDRPAGRGLKLAASEVKKLAQIHQLKVEQPLSLKGGGAYDLIAAANADAMIVAAYGLIVPKAILNLPGLGCINIHASLLPRWRGAAPIQRAILAGDLESGVTLMQMDEGLDTGGMLLKRAISIGENETAGELHDRLAVLGSELIVEALRVYATLSAPLPQDEAQVSYAAKISKAEAIIDWCNAATGITRKVRAYNPYPGAITTLGIERIKIWRAQMENHVPREPGTVCLNGPNSLVIACGQGAVKVLELQRAGGKRLAVESFLAGYPLADGARFGQHEA